VIGEGNWLRNGWYLVGNRCCGAGQWEKWYSSSNNPDNCLSWFHIEIAFEVVTRLVISLTRWMGFGQCKCMADVGVVEFDECS